MLIVPYGSMIYMSLCFRQYLVLASVLLANLFCVLVVEFWFWHVHLPILIRWRKPCYMCFTSWSLCWLLSNFMVMSGLQEVTENSKRRACALLRVFRWWSGKECLLKKPIFPCSGLLRRRQSMNLYLIIKIEVWGLGRCIIKTSIASSHLSFRCQKAVCSVVTQAIMYDCWLWLFASACSSWHLTFSALT